MGEHHLVLLSRFNTRAFEIRRTWCATIARIRAKRLDEKRAVLQRCSKPTPTDTLIHGRRNRDPCRSLLPTHAYFRDVVTMAYCPLTREITPTRRRNVSHFRNKGIAILFVHRVSHFVQRYIYISMETGFGRLLERNGIRYNIRIEVSREGMLAEKTKKSDEKRIDSIAMIMASSWK